MRHRATSRATPTIRWTVPQAEAGRVFVSSERRRSTDIRANAPFLEPSEVAAYVKDVQTAAFLNHFHRGYRIIIDLSACQIQSQETLAAFAKHMTMMPKAQRIAIVVGNTPAIGQIRRLFSQPYAKLVADRDAALKWVNSPIG